MTNCPGLPATCQVSALRVLYPQKHLCPRKTKAAGHPATFHPTHHLRGWLGGLDAGEDVGLSCVWTASAGENLRPQATCTSQARAGGPRPEQACWQLRPSVMGVSTGLEVQGPTF